ncbi:MAG: hypothetical protein M0R49_08560 [Limnochordia bacterium]|nr:hypothetical protein [Limnochordia bacterium]
MNKIESIKIRMELDNMPDTSYLGEYTDEMSDYVIERHSEKYVKHMTESEIDDIPRRGNEYRFFKPYAAGEPEGTRRYYRYGRMDLKRMEALNRGDWGHIGIHAEARILVNGIGQTVTSMGLYGVESDSGKGYLREIAKEELVGLKSALTELNVDMTNFDDLKDTALNEEEA